MSLNSCKEWDKMFMKLWSYLKNIFDVADKFKHETRKTDWFDKLMKKIKFVQITACLQSVIEILELLIFLLNREKLSIDMCKKLF